jgi:hypothetical protein
MGRNELPLGRLYAAVSSRDSAPWIWRAEPNFERFDPRARGETPQSVNVMAQLSEYFAGKRADSISQSIFRR